ncbi:Hypothetical protein A7982_06456 [Minicystis rosea]|nr:Hypothetical protein A7982_06456 [Minicystis rosea]
MLSWFLARLAHLARGRFPFGWNDVLHNDGGGVYLRFIAFTADLAPVAFLMVHGDASKIACHVECAAGSSPDEVCGAFASAFLEEPARLGECKVTTIDTDPPELPARRRGDPQVFGWDGKSFLGRQPATGDLPAARSS